MLFANNIVIKSMEQVEIFTGKKSTECSSKHDNIHVNNRERQAERSRDSEDRSLNT